MVNLQLIDGVSFTKGCYTGQEVVARMKYLGKLKRRMYLAHVDTTTPPRPGDKLFSSSSQSSQGAGKVVDAQVTPNGGYDLLAVAEISLVEADDLHLIDATGPRLQLLELPYSLEEQVS
jgi:folate-binding Fe-S cluster repair protein YgfZ